MPTAQQKNYRAPCRSCLLAFHSRVSSLRVRPGCFCSGLARPLLERLRLADVAAHTRHFGRSGRTEKLGWSALSDRAHRAVSHTGCGKVAPVPVSTPRQLPCLTRAAVSLTMMMTLRPWALTSTLSSPSPSCCSTTAHTAWTGS